MFAELGPPAYAIKARVQLLRDLGSSAAPFNAFLVSQGLETLSLRMERHNENARKVVDFLSGHPQVERIQFAGHPESKWHERANEIGRGRGYGSVPHGGFGMGIERVVAWICGLEHVRETIPYPRMLYRLYP